MSVSFTTGCFSDDWFRRIDVLVHRFRNSNHIMQPFHACSSRFERRARHRSNPCSHNAILEFLFGCNAEVAQDRAGELGEEAFDEVEPGTMVGREGEF